MTISDWCSSLRDFFVSNFAVIGSIITLFIAAYLNNLNKKNLDEQDKNRHLSILRRCSSVKDGFAKISIFRNDIYSRYYWLLTGIIIGLVALNIFEWGWDKIFTSISHEIPPVFSSIFVYFFSIFLTFGLPKLYESRFLQNKTSSSQPRKFLINPELKKVLYMYYFSAGTIIGINCAVVLQLYNKYLDILFLYAYFYLLGISMSIIYQYYLKKNISRLYFKCIKKIMDFYRDNFPYVTIKTPSGEVNGKLWDVLNKDVIVLKESKTLKAVPWNKIDVIEVKK